MSTRSLDPSALHSALGLLLGLGIVLDLGPGLAVGSAAAERNVPQGGAPRASGSTAPLVGELLVRRGDRVQLGARIGAVTAEVEAEALQDGRSGELIRVRNLHSGRVQQGRVTRAGYLEVTN